MPAPTTSTLADGEVNTEHLHITYPAGQEARAAEMLSYAEDVFADVNAFFEGALPAHIDVSLENHIGSSFNPRNSPQIIIGIAASGSVKEILAHELTHAAFHELVRRPSAKNYRFFNEGLATWIEAGYESGQAGKRSLWAAYGHQQGMD